jgi:2'-5' RNA ligase
VGKRLFIAVDIDDATRTQIERISAGVRDAVGADTKATWVHPGRMHLTLQFLGNVEESVEQHVRDALAEPIREAPFDVTFDGLGFFPERGSPRVLWLGIREGLQPLRRIRSLVGLGLRRALPTADESFSPHLTLARFRDRVRRANLAGITRIPASAGPSLIDRVTLYESRLSPAGPTYVPLAHALLRP